MSKLDCIDKNGRSRSEVSMQPEWKRYRKLILLTVLVCKCIWSCRRYEKNEIGDGTALRMFTKSGDVKKKTPSFQDIGRSGNILWFSRVHEANTICRRSKISVNSIADQLEIKKAVVFQENKSLVRATKQKIKCLSATSTDTTMRVAILTFPRTLSTLHS